MNSNIQSYIYIYIDIYSMVLIPNPSPAYIPNPHSIIMFQGVQPFFPWMLVSGGGICCDLIVQVTHLKR